MTLYNFIIYLVKLTLRVHIVNIKYYALLLIMHYFRVVIYSKVAIRKTQIWSH